MTLEQANTQAIAAARAGDLEGLGKALRARGAAIAELKRQAPSAEVAGRMKDAIEAGGSIGEALFFMKQRLGFESARLARFAGGIAAGCGVDRGARE
jgi:hypothetical protein